MKKPSEGASLGAFSVSGEFFIHDHMGADAGYVKGAAGALPAELFVISLYVTSGVAPDKRRHAARYAVSSAVIKSRLSHQAAS